MELGARPVRLMVAVAIFVTVLSGILLGLSDEGLAMLGLTTTVLESRGALGGALLISITMLTTVGLFELLGRGRVWLEKSGRQRFLEGRLARLTPDEKLLLKPFVLSSTRRQQLPAAGALVDELVRGGALVRSNRADDASGHYFEISEWAWDYLNRHPDLVLDPQELSNRRRSMAQTLRR